MRKISKQFANKVPASNPNSVNLFIDSMDNTLKFKDSDGVVSEIASNSSNSSNGQMQWLSEYIEPKLGTVRLHYAINKIAENSIGEAKDFPPYFMYSYESNSNYHERWSSDYGGSIIEYTEGTILAYDNVLNSYVNEEGFRAFFYKNIILGNTTILKFKPSEYKSFNISFDPTGVYRSLSQDGVPNYGLNPSNTYYNLLKAGPDIKIDISRSYREYESIAITDIFNTFNDEDIISLEFLAIRDDWCRLVIKNNNVKVYETRFYISGASLSSLVFEGIRKDSQTLPKLGYSSTFLEESLDTILVPEE